MKNVLSFVFVVVILAISANAQAVTWILTAQSTFPAGQPQSIYEVNPGPPADKASVTVTNSSNYTCTNNSASTRTAYLTWTPSVNLNVQPSNPPQTKLNNAAQRTTTSVLPPQMSWTLNNDTISASGLIPIGLYRAYATTTITEDKTGEAVSSGITTKDVEVRPHG